MKFLNDNFDSSLLVNHDVRFFPSLQCLITCRGVNKK